MGTPGWVHPPAKITAEPDPAATTPTADADPEGLGRGGMAREPDNPTRLKPMCRRVAWAPAQAVANRKPPGNLTPCAPLWATLGATVCLASAKARNKTKAQGEGVVVEQVEEVAEVVSAGGDRSAGAVDPAKPSPAQSILQPEPST